MPEPKTRSSFLPFLFIIVAVVICAGVVVVFTPLVECDVCLGVGTVTVKEGYALAEDQHKESPDLGDDMERIFWRCKWCTGTSRISLSRNWGKDISECIRLSEEDRKVQLRRIRELRESTP